MLDTELRQVKWSSGLTPLMRCWAGVSHRMLPEEPLWSHEEPRGKLLFSFININSACNVFISRQVFSTYTSLTNITLKKNYNMLFICLFNSNPVLTMLCVLHNTLPVGLFLLTLLHFCFSIISFFYLKKQRCQVSCFWQCGHYIENAFSHLT